VTTQVGSKPEVKVYNALVKLGISFDFQSAQLGGRQELGGMVLDFYIPDLYLGINVQSEYYHYGNPERIAIDKTQKAILETMGIKVIYIDEEDALRNAVYYVKEALAGRDHSRMRDL